MACRAVRGTVPGVSPTGPEHPAVDAAITRLREVCSSRGLPLVSIDGAIGIATRAHDGQTRRSGEPYICHPLEVATLVADLGADESSVLAAVLHDTVEDTELTLAEIASDFGIDVAALVDGCTKVAQVRAGDQEGDLSAQRLRKLFVALAADPRVVVVKVADRLHNLRTIAALPPAKAARIGTETLAIHAPLAHRLGLAAWKAELEDRAFAVAYPSEHDALAAQLDSIDGLTERLEVAREQLTHALGEAGITADVSGRIKHLWSIRTKCARSGCTPTGLHDLVAVRAIVDTEADCYAALAVAHAAFEPVPERFKDYIAKPKFNLYQSLHTSVRLDDGAIVEIQIRTQEMHRTAERGAAAHADYKHGIDPAWVARLLAWSADDSDFLDGVARELASREITILTPGGDVIALPEGAGVIDFAYAVHTDVGHRCSGAIVDGRLVPFSTTLRSGQTVQIRTSRDSGPSLDWLDYAVTAHARRTIRRHFTRQWRTEAVATGRARVERALAVHTELTLEDLLRSAGLRQAEQLYEQVGRGRVEPRRLIEKARRKHEPAEPLLPPSRDQVPALEGLPGLPTRVAGCCQPAPGTPITGLAGAPLIAIHSLSCPRLTDIAQDSPGRLIRAAWVLPGEELITHEVTAQDVPGVRAALSAAVTSVGARATAVRRLGPDRWSVVAAATHPRAKALAVALRATPGVSRALRR